MSKRNGTALDFSRVGAQRTFDWTRNQVEGCCERAFDVDVQAWLAASNDPENVRRMLLHIEVVAALAAWLADGEPEAEHRAQAEAILREVVPSARGRPAISHAARRPDFARAAVYARAIRTLWRAHGVVLNRDMLGTADEWGARMALGELDLSREASGACADLTKDLPDTLRQPDSRSYVATPILELEP